MTDAELRDQAVAALKQTTISYPEWLNRIKNGYKGKPYNPVGTNWWKAFDYLEQIGLAPQDPVEQPRPPFELRDGQGTRESFPDCFVLTTQSVTIKGKHVKNVTGYGVGSYQPWPPAIPVPGRTFVTDCKVENVAAKPPGSMGGKGEMGFWFSNPTDAGRISAENCAWAGINLVGTSAKSNLSDVTLRNMAVGLYVEHNSYQSTISRLQTFDIKDRPVAGGKEPGGVLAARSITHEWWHRNPDFGNQVVGPYGNLYVDCDLYCPANSGNPNTDPRAGSYEGAGVYGNRYVRCRFWGPGPAVIGASKRYGGGPAPVLEDCVFDQDGPNLIFHDLPFGT